VKLRAAPPIAIAIGGALAILAYGGLSVVRDRERVSSSAALAKPRKYHLEEEPDQRARVILQACWWPNDKAQLSVAWGLGASGTSADKVGAPLTCVTPWQRTAVLGLGDRVTLGWTVIAGPVSKVKYRITINNRARVEDGSERNTFIYSCVLGVPPCELP
jgi:hypothetical protein